MEPSQKKRGIFGSLNFWSRPQEVPTDPDKKAEYYRTADMANTPPIPRVGFNASPEPESPAKRASAAQLSTRRIIDRPQGPSSKLSQSISATDFARLPATPRTTNFSTAATPSSEKAVATVRRMPGDNPNKNSVGFAANNRRVANFSGAATTPRNMFRSSALNDRPSFSFSPRVPYNTVKESFPPTTPGKAPRGSTAELNGRALTHTASAPLFAMRIPSPPPDLTGERLAKEVPENHNRAGSIYADEFLTDYCPSDFDDLQRRQFFCILDLRRLKYAADEVFAKKDWKINILNFAKEYEKSRSLIMLRYGLYEFKTVKPSEALKKQWQKEHGIPESDDEKDMAASYKAKSSVTTVGRLGGAGKRKAEEDLPPKDSSVLTKSSTTNLNKRRVMDREPLAEKRPIFASNSAKRKADEVGEPDENNPSKLQKPTVASPQTSSSVKSIFERIANGTLNESGKAATLPKQTPSPKPVNGGLGRSVLDAGSKPSMANNIFGHLSDASKGSGNDDADSEASTDSSPEVDEESEAQETTQSKEASVAASGGTSTPQFGTGTGLFSKKPNDTAASSTSSETGESTKGKSLFDRLTYGNDGQPVRVLTPQPEAAKEPTPETTRPTSPLKASNGIPSDNTWNTGTPIKFAPTTAAPSLAVDSASQKSAPSSLFGTKEPTPSAPAVEPEAAAPAKRQAEETATTLPEAPKSATPQLLFNKSPSTSSATAAFGAGASKAEDMGSKLFSSSSTVGFGQHKPAEVPKDGITKAADTGSKIFPPPNFGFGQQKPAEEQKDSATPAPASSAMSLFGAAPKPSGPETSKPASVFQSSTLFGNATKAADVAKPVFPQSNPLAGSDTAAKSTESPALATSAPSIFASNASKPSGNLFAAVATPAVSTPSLVQPQAKPIFGATGNQATGSLFGASAPKPTETPKPKDLFGAASATPVSKPLFGGASTSQAEPAKSQSGIFANASNVSTPVPVASTPAPVFSFGGSQSAAPAPQFGAGNAQQSAPQSGPSIFGSGGSSSFSFAPSGGQQTTFNNPFATNSGGSSAPPSFNFGSDSTAGTGNQTSSTAFKFGASTPTPTISFGAGSGTSTPGGQPPNASSAAANGASPFTFGANTSQPNTSSMFSQQKPGTPAPSFFAGSLAPPAGGTSTGTNSPFNFGGASSLATTPATGTPEPGAQSEDGQEKHADGDDAPQEQISLTEGGPGEEDEVVVYEVRAKAMKFVMAGKDSDAESGSGSKDNKSPWKVQGVGPLRILKNKTTGLVRMVLRSEPRGNLALNKRLLPESTYKPEPAGGKYIKVEATSDDGSSFETWMIQVKNKELAKELADVLETNKVHNKK